MDENDGSDEADPEETETNQVSSDEENTEEREEILNEYRSASDEFQSGMEHLLATFSAVHSEGDLEKAEQRCDEALSDFLGARNTFSSIEFSATGIPGGSEVSGACEDATEKSENLIFAVEAIQTAINEASNPPVHYIISEYITKSNESNLTPSVDIKESLEL
ncbi:hypothetical protein [Halorubrum salipaludis]|uniref:hypothetical protein n=1 Tax=Halorubrum salipaludis TaxID=2032630 RepID=UPI001181B39D|nr:hypothetical protein [Halorubrum salipaludis]